MASTTILEEQHHAIGLTRKEASGFDPAKRVHGGTISLTKLLSLMNGGKTLEWQERTSVFKLKLPNIECKTTT